jgi:hypothetical protein
MRTGLGGGVQKGARGSRLAPRGALEAGCRLRGRAEGLLCARRGRQVANIAEDVVARCRAGPPVGALWAAGRSGAAAGAAAAAAPAAPLADVANLGGHAAA